MSINLKITPILSICMRQKNGDKVPRTGKKYIDWHGYILVGGLYPGFMQQRKEVQAPLN